jgi:uncharacterized repeat protein (TIGR03803 family)
MIGQALLTMFLLIPAPVFAQAKSFEVLHQFKGSPSDGSTSVASLLLDSAGNLYGTTRFGGASNNGTVFKLTAGGALTLLYSFCVQPCTGDGFQPEAGLIWDRSGNLYGTTTAGPYPADNGTVFRLSPTGNGQWKESILYGFKAINDGYDPKSGVIRDASGNLYGTTFGYNDSGSTGMVYELSPTSSGPWTETDLFTFPGGAIGGGPEAGVIMDGNGNLYGTTTWDGPGAQGVVFMLTRSPSVPWKETTLFTFNGGTDGGYPEGNLIMDAQGNLYSTTSGGNGNGGGGVVFKLTRSPSTPWTETLLHSFCAIADCPDGRQPLAGLVRDTQGNLYGTTNLGGDSHGLGNACPTCAPNRYGVVYKIDTSGNESVLYSFTGQGDGSNPAAGLIIDGEGNLYGTTSTGGDSTCHCGTVFKIVP